MPDQTPPVLGLIINPIAGMGGPVALRGTDARVEEARQRGARPVAQGRARRFLAALRGPVRLLTCGGPMGGDACAEAGVSFEVVVEVSEPTTAEDTRRAARTLAQREVDLLCFLGGDGTAMDVAEAVGTRVPVLGVPSGVKMNSACFGETPEAAAEVAGRFLRGQLDTGLAEVVEVDEAALRDDELYAVTLGELRVPQAPLVQPSKAEPGGTLEGVVEAVEDLVHPGAVLVLGAGSTTLAAKEALVGEGTLLGIDVVRVSEDGTPVLWLADATANDLSAVPDHAVLVLSPIGGQGFVVGRGNQQLTPGLLDRLGWDQVVVVATPAKLEGLGTLRADTGDPLLDEAAPRHLYILTGPGFRRLLPLRAGKGPYSGGVGGS